MIHFLKEDEQRPKIVQFSELGLVELTRKRGGKVSNRNVFCSTTKNNQYTQNAYISNVVARYSFGHSLFLDTFVIYSV